MASRRSARPSILQAPFLRGIRLLAERVPAEAGYPFDLPVLAAEPLDLAFTDPVTILVGVNGSGKSTLIEAIAALCGFGAQGGNRNYALASGPANPLADALRAAWLPKVATGFYIRAETMMGFIDQVDAIAAETPQLLICAEI